MVLGPWGALAGGVIGGAAGALGGLAGDKQAKAKAAAARRLAEAQARYGAQTTQLNQSAGAEAGQMGQDYRAALQQYVGQHPDAMPRFQQAQQQFTQDQQTAQAPAWAAQPQLTGGAGQGTGAEQRYLAALQADRQGRASAAMAPGTMQLARQEVGRQDQLGQQDLGYRQAAMAQAMDRLRGMTGLQQQLNYEQVAQAQNQYGIDRQRANQAGASQALASGLLSSAGNMAGAFGLAQASRPQPTTSGPTTYFS